VPDQLLNILQLCLLALLYLFFLRVLRAVWVEVGAPRRRPADDGASPRPGAVPPAPPAAGRGDGRAGRRSRARTVTAPSLVVVAPSELAGSVLPLGEELTVGRAAACTVTLDDAFVSQVHARFTMRDGQVHVEDLGSTNGTYLNRRRVAGPVVMKRRDRLQIGNTVLEMT
jgi:hypothetical protein